MRMNQCQEVQLLFLKKCLVIRLNYISLSRSICSCFFASCIHPRDITPDWYLWSIKPDTSKHYTPSDSRYRATTTSLRWTYATRSILLFKYYWIPHSPSSSRQYSNLVTPHLAYPGMDAVIDTSCAISKLNFLFVKLFRRATWQSISDSHLQVSEHYEYQVLPRQLKLPSALQLVKSFTYDSTPYKAALHALLKKYSQTRQLVHRKLGVIVKFPSDLAMRTPLILLGMCLTLERHGGFELQRGSHVNPFRLLIDTLLMSLCFGKCWCFESYVTPSINLHAPMEAVMSSLCSTECRLSKDSRKAES